MEMQKIKSIRVKNLLITFACLIPGFISGQDNLALNGGFEEGTGTVWDLLASGGSTVNYELSTEDPAEGFYCLKADVIETGSDPWSIQIKNGSFGVVAGVSYQISIWAKANTAGSTVNYTVGKATADYTEYAVNRGLALTTEWTKYTLNMVSPVTTADDITLALHILDQDIYWFDDFSVISSPVLLSNVSSDGTKINLTFAQEMSDPSAEPQITFMVDINLQKLIKVNSVNYYNDQSHDRFQLQLNDTIRKSDVVTLNYYPGTIATKTGQEIDAFSVDINNSSAVTDINESLKDKIYVYPNPAYDNIVIRNIDLSCCISACIIDIMGTEVQRVDIKDGFINVGDIKTGIYFLQLYNTDGSIWTYKFIKN